MSCEAGALTCVATECSDGMKDGSETDVDCGGSTCSPCGLGMACLVNADCTSFGCDVHLKVCIAATCTDGQQNGDETGIDCGGGTCRAPILFPPASSLLQRRPLQV